MEHFTCYQEAFIPIYDDSLPSIIKRNIIDKNGNELKDFQTSKTWSYYETKIGKPIDYISYTGNIDDYHVEYLIDRYDNEGIRIWLHQNDFALPYDFIEECNLFEYVYQNIEEVIYYDEIDFKSSKRVMLFQSNDGETSMYHDIGPGLYEHAVLQLEFDYNI